VSDTRIVYVTTVDLTVRFLLLDQLRHLRQAGYQVSAVCAQGPWTEEIRAAGIPVHSADLRRQISPLADLAALAALVRLFRAVRPHLVHTHTPKANLLGRLAARLAGVPVVVGTEHGFYFYGMTGLRRRFWVWLARLGARWSDAVFLINAEDVDTARREGICRLGQSVYVPGGVGVDVGRYAPGADAAPARASLGLPADAPVAGMVGRLTYEKGYDDFFRAAVIVRQALPEARFLVVGPTDRQEEAEFRRLVDSLGLANAVTFAGMRTDLPRVYPAMDLVCLPSHREGLPVTLMEAAAMGLPCVASDIRGCRDVVEDGVTGLLTAPGDSASLAVAILALLGNPARRRQMGQAARQRAETVFDQRLVFAQVEGEYRRLLTAKGLA
jgi:glycosyltransferase involved in cell wall biosynthesis